MAALLALGLAACAEAPRQPVVGSPSEGLVFVARRDGNPDLHRLRLADGAVGPLVETPGRDELWPFWSEAARRLVFQSRASGAHDDRLVLLDPESGRRETLPGPEGRNEQWAAWSPDGAALAYVFVDRPGIAGTSGIGVFRPATGAVVEAVGAVDPVRFFRPEFAPDGRRLVAERTLGAGSTLWILEPGAAPRALGADRSGHEEKGRFTRDGAFVVYTRRTRPGARGELAVVASGGGGVRALARRPGADDHSARPSPTRDEVVFISDRDGNPEAYRVALDGGAPRRLTHTPGRAEAAPHWSPDGEWIALTTRRLDAGADPGARDERIAVVDREGRLRLEIPGTMPDWMPPWPDGR